MRRRILAVILTGVLLPLLFTLAILYFLTARMEKSYARQRLNSILSGVESFDDRVGGGILAQIQALAGGDDLKRSLLLATEIGIIDQAALIKSTVSSMNLLNLDYLVVTGPAGQVLAQGHEPAAFGFSLGDDLVIFEALTGQQVRSLGARRLSGVPQVLMLAASPVWFKNRVIGVVAGGVLIDNAYLQNLRALSDAEFVLVEQGGIQASTLAVGPESLPKATSTRPREINVGGVNYQAAVFPLHDFSGHEIAEMAIAVDVHEFQGVYGRTVMIFLVLALGGFVFALILSFTVKLPSSDPADRAGPGAADLS